MLIQDTFKADLFSLKHSVDAVQLLNRIEQESSIRLAETIIKSFPYQKDESKSFHGELPSMSLNRQHEFFDTYSTSFIAISRETFSEILKLLTQPVPDIQQAIKLLSE